MKLILVAITFLANSIKNGARGITMFITATIDYIVYAVFVKIFGFSIVVANLISWIISGSLVFFTDKLFTYKGRGSGLVIKEYVTFFLARAFIVIIETFILKITIDFLGLEELLMKIIAMILVVVMTITFKRFIVYRKSKHVSKIELIKKLKKYLGQKERDN